MRRDGPSDEQEAFPLHNQRGNRRDGVFVEFCMTIRADKPLFSLWRLFRDLKGCPTIITVVLNNNFSLQSPLPFIPSLQGRGKLPLPHVTPFYHDVAFVKSEALAKAEGERVRVRGKNALSP